METDGIETKPRASDASALYLNKINSPVRLFAAFADEIFLQRPNMICLSTRKEPGGAEISGRNPPFWTII